MSILYGAAEASSPRPSRVSYLIDGEGTIRKVYASVTPAEHADEVLRDLGGSAPSST